jgi:hypothetical protein
MRRELSDLIEEGRRDSGRDVLAMADPLLARGGAIVVPVVTAVGSRLLLATAGPIVTVLDLPQLTTKRLKEKMHGAAGRMGWLAAFDRDVPDRIQHARHLVETIGEELWSLFAGTLVAALQELGVSMRSRLMLLPSGALGFLPLGLARDPESGRRLIEDYEMVYGPSLAALGGAHEHTARPELGATSCFVLMHSNLRSLLRTAQAMRASSLASAIASTLWCRRFLAASIQDLSP